MKKTSKLLTFMLSVTVLLLITGTAAFADDGTVVLSGGSLTLTSDAGGFAFGSVTLDGNKNSSTDEIGTGADNSVWSMVDARGTGLGWAISVASSNLTGFINTLSVPVTLTITSSATPAYNEFGLMAQISQAGSDVSVIAGAEGSMPVGLLSYSSESGSFMTGTGQTVSAAPVDQGMGGYDIDPLYTIYVPAGAYAGTGALTLTVTKADLAP